MKVKIKDIAKAAGVSPTTVSLVLNKKPSRIADDTREQVLKIAREMQFQNETGIDCSGFGKVKTLGLLVPDAMNSFYHQLAEEVAKNAFMRGYLLFQCYTDDSLECFCKAVEGLMSKNVDGIIVIPPRTLDKENIKLLKSAQKSHVPLVLLDRAAYSLFCDLVTADNKHGGRIAAEYMIERGHKRIGCMMGDSRIYTAQKRLEGYREALAAHKIPFETSLVYQGNYDIDSGFKGAGELVNQGVTAIVAGNDLMAFGIYVYAKTNSLSIPDDLSVIGYDNTELCRFMDVPLTSVDQNACTMASKAVEVLLKWVERDEQEEEPVRNYYFTPHIVERKSVKRIGAGN